MIRSLLPLILALWLLMAEMSAFCPAHPSTGHRRRLRQTQICEKEQSWAGDTNNSNNNNNDDDAFMAALRSRVANVQDRETKLPLVLLDSMLPRQSLQLQVQNPLMMELVKDCLERERPFVGMLGMARLQNGQMINLQTGVECKLVDPVFVDEGVQLTFQGGRRFVIDGDVEETPLGWTECRVKFLDSEEEEGKEDKDSLDEAIELAKGFTSKDHPKVEESTADHLVDLWILWAKKKERSPGQMQELLACLGEMPPATEPTERALWVGALINPLPSMGVSLEIRPQLLMAKSAKDRVQIAMDAIVKSIGHMDGSQKLF